MQSDDMYLRQAVFQLVDHALYTQKYVLIERQIRHACRRLSWQPLRFSWLRTIECCKDAKRVKLKSIKDERYAGCKLSFGLFDSDR